MVTVTALAIHPALAAVTVILVVTAYLLKTRKRQYFYAHYAAAITAFSMFLVAFPVALFEVGANGGPSVFPGQLMFHFLNFLVAAGLLTAQAAMGMSMLIWGRKRRIIRLHKALSKYVVVIMLLQGLLGLTVFFGILPYIFT